MWPLPLSIGVFVGGALLTVVLGVRLSRVGDELADRTGLGEAIFGSVFFGGIISLSGIVMTATAAADGHASLAYSNAVGGVAAQVVALAVADIAYRKANLEHAAASMPNATFAVVLSVLLCIALMATFAPPITVFGIGLATPCLLGAYLYGIRQVKRVHGMPQWYPRKTEETVEDQPNQGSDHSTRRLWLEFVGAGLIVSAGGWAIAKAAASFVEHLGLNASFVGAIMMGVVNAIPETVTAIAAVRAGAVTLAVGGVLGGNAFDVLNLAVGDVAYRDGSLFHAAQPNDLFVTIASLTMTLIVLGGLLRREKHGPLGVGFEGIAVLAVYGLVVAVTVT